MASIKNRDDGRWRARYRDAAGREHSRHFHRRVDAQTWLDAVTTAANTGTYTDPRRGDLTVGEWASRWLEGQVHLKPSTHERYAGIIREPVLPRWRDVRLAEVEHSAVRAWLGGLAAQRSAATVVKAHRVMSLIMKTAVKDRRLTINPCDGITLPRVVKGQHRYLTHEHVDRLVDACAAPPVDRGKRASNVWPDDYRLVVLFLAYTSARWGEMAALRADRIDFLRRRASIVESVTVVKGRLGSGTPEDHERRDLPLTRFRTEALAAHVGGEDRDELAFTGQKGGVLRAQVFQRAVLTKAAAAIGVHGLHPHELRHYRGVAGDRVRREYQGRADDVGHESATKTLDLYGDLFPDQLDESADALDSAVAEMREKRGPAADFLRTFCGLRAS